ncbi:MAG TPA: hypothetical protein PLD35_05830, partial [Caldisericia bacterium]|nr:hypothetical protein [Caldisericia bacterium]
MLLSFLLFTLFFLPPNITEAFNIKPRRNIPISPPPITLNKEKQTKPTEVSEKRTEHSKTFKNPDGTFSLFYYPRKIHKRDGKGGWVDIDKVDSKNDKDLKLLSNGNPTPLSLCLYANGSSFTNSQTEHEGEMWLENYTDVSSETYILYPDLRDLIPQTGSLTEVKIVTEFIDPEPDTFTVEAYAITQAWNPHTLDETNIPPTEPNPSATAIWNLAEGTEREQRSIDITTLALDWFSGTKGSYGVKLKIQDPPSQDPNGIQGAPLPVLLTKYQVEGSPSDPTFGGSYYSDSLTPPQLIPGRALFVHRVGEIGNIVKAWTVSNLNITEGLPFGIDILSVNLKTNETFTVEQFIPTDTFPCSNSYFLTYSFPALDDDIYPNNALNILPPSQDPNPPNLNPDPPGPNSYQFLNLTENPSINHNFIDISPLIATPVSSIKYPNYPLLNNFTLVIQDDDSRFSNNIIQPLSSLPYIQLDYALDIGSDGETENTIAKEVSSFNAELLSGMVNPTNLNVMLSGDIMSFSTHGGLSASLTLTYNSEYEGTNGSRWLTNLDQYVSYDSQTNVLTYHTSSGSIIRFNPIYDESGSFNNQFYPPGSTNTKAFLRSDLPSNRRYELRSKTEDLSVFFSESNGKVTFAQTKQDGSLIYNYSLQNPNLIVSIEDSYSGRRLNFTYDSYNRITVVEDPIGRMAIFQYNENNNVVNTTSYDGVSVNYIYKVETMKVSSLAKIGGPCIYLSVQEEEVGVSDESGPPSKIALDDQNRTATVTDPNGATTEFKFYPQGQLKELTNALGEKQTYYYDSEHASYAVKETKDCNGETNVFNYNEDRNIEEIIDKAGNSSHIEFSEKGKPIVATDREGNSTTCVYNEDGSVPLIYTDALGNEVSLTYDENKFVMSTTYPYKEGENVVVNYTYDSYGYPDTVTDPLQNVTDYDYDEVGRLLKITFPNGAKEEFIYDENERLHQVKGTDPEGNSKVSTIEYNPNTGNPISVTNPAGNTTTFNYDNYDKLTSITDPLGNSTSYEYDSAGYVTKITDARNNSVSFVYDALGRTTSVTDPLGNTYTYNYDSCGELSSVVDPLGNAVHLYYDEVGHLTQMKDPQNNIFSFTYNKEGYLKSLTDPKGADYYLNYNSIYQVINLRNPKGTETNYEYYPFGGIKKATNPLGQYVTYDYDEDFRPIKVTDHQNRFTEYTYDNADRVTQIKDHTNRITKFKYDGFGNLTETEDPLGNKTKFEYDISNNLTATITPMNERYEYYYDALDRVIKTLDPLGHERKYTYDEVSNLVQFENPLENLTKWAYDKRDQVEKATDPLNNDFYYTYDELGRLTKEKDPLNREF